MSIISGPTVLELFAGVGGLSLGFHNAGFKIVGAVEIDPINITTYRHNFPEVPVFQKDVTEINAESLLNHFGRSIHNVDVLVGGPPCQGFSLIGRRDENDPRNVLFTEMARLIGEVRPRYFVVDNVSGLLHGYGRQILNRFIKITMGYGYRVVTPQVLQASHFNVPQRRKRVFILGYRDAMASPQYPVYENTSCTTVWDAIGDLPNVDDFLELLTSDVYIGPLGPANKYVEQLRDRAGEGLTGCGRTRHTVETVRRFQATTPGAIEPISRFLRLRPDGLSNTIRAGTDKSNGSHTAPRPIHPFHPRCITVREAARLQSFPDWFQFHPTKWHALRQIGNAVPPLLAEAVAMKILANL